MLKSLLLQGLGSSITRSVLLQWKAAIEGIGKDVPTMASKPASIHLPEVFCLGLGLESSEASCAAQATDHQVVGLSSYSSFDELPDPVVVPIESEAQGFWPKQRHSPLKTSDGLFR